MLDLFLHLVKVERKTKILGEENINYVYFHIRTTFTVDKTEKVELNVLRVDDNLAFKLFESVGKIIRLRVDFNKGEHIITGSPLDNIDFDEFLQSTSPSEITIN